MIESARSGMQCRESCTKRVRLICIYITTLRVADTQPPTPTHLLLHVVIVEYEPKKGKEKVKKQCGRVVSRCSRSVRTQAPMQKETKLVKKRLTLLIGGEPHYWGAIVL